jgi:hypothetical protein
MSWLNTFNRSSIKNIVCSSSTHLVRTNYCPVSACLGKVWLAAQTTATWRRASTATRDVATQAATRRQKCSATTLRLWYAASPRRCRALWLGDIGRTSCRHTDKAALGVRVACTLTRSTNSRKRPHLKIPRWLLSERKSPRPGGGLHPP